MDKPDFVVANSFLFKLSKVVVQVIQAVLAYLLDVAAQAVETFETLNRGIAYQWCEQRHHVPALDLFRIFQCLAGIVEKGITA